MRRLLLVPFLLLSACDRGGTAIPAAAPDAHLAVLAVKAEVPSSPLRPLPPVAERPAAGGFDGATAWLNVDHAVTLDELKGHVVVVDFWTSCCINCIHTLPVLAAIETQFEKEPVVVVGVHSPKFDAESERERLRAVVQEYSIAHPVAVDGSMKVWNAWGVQSWPSVFVIDAHGRIVWTHGGEPDRDELAAVVRSALAESVKDGSIKREKVAGLRAEKDTSGALAFPGKVVAFADGSLGISDTGHHRVVFTDAAGKVTDVVGTGLAGKTDGSYGEASFHKPQGLAQIGDIVYVADTENHEIRAIDRRAKSVTTVAGTGDLGREPLREATPARTTALRSPWDVLAVGNTVYVALAGSHQIAAFDPKGQTIRAFAGDGRERRKDGAALESSFAQPSGLASDGARLFVADSETSSIRAIDLKTSAVRTIVGKDLFVFGDVDGIGDQVRLQHPIGIAFGAGSIWVSDTYNSKIKRIDPGTGKTQTFAGGGDRKELFEPAGLAFRADEILVADTHHHRLIGFPIAGGASRPFALADLTAPSRGVAVAQATERPRAKPEERVHVAEGTIAKSGNSKVHVAWQTPAGTGVNEDAPFRARWIASNGLAQPPVEIRTKGSEVQNGFEFSLVPAPGAERVHLIGDLDLVICDVATHRVCIPVRREVELTFRTEPTAPPPRITFALPDANAK
jgi:thiol-disulfide isomerase/thioredoxin/DNA-binding beta-propeller fold protein YncE